MTETFSLFKPVELPIDDVIDVLKSDPLWQGLYTFLTKHLFLDRLLHQGPNGLKSVSLFTSER